MSQWPTFFIIGAAKAATTSLHAYLASHPQIHMSAVKEPCFFAPAEAGDLYPPNAVRPRVQDEQAYRDLFRTDRRVRGEASPAYSQCPRVPGVPDRIRATIPDARFIYLVRDPVERAVSHYMQVRLAGRERRSITEAFVDLESPDHEYTCASRYATQLDAYLEHFAAEQILVLDQAKMLADQAEVLRDIAHFLEVDPSGMPTNAPPHNVRSAKRADSPLLFRLRTSAARRWADRLPESVRRSAVHSARRLLSKSAPDIEVPIEVRQRLLEHLTPEVDRLRRLTNQRFDGWSV